MANEPHSHGPYHATEVHPNDDGLHGSQEYSRVFDHGFRLRHANPAYHKVRDHLGLGPERDGIFDNVEDTEQVRIRRLLADLTPEHDMVSYEHAVAGRDGTLCWQQWTDRAEFDSNGNVTQYRSVGRSIDLQKHAEWLAELYMRDQQLLAENGDPEPSVTGEVYRLRRAQALWARKYALDKLLRDVAVAANQAETREDVLRIALSRICAHTGWPIGHVFERDEQSGQLVTTRVWHLQDERKYMTFKRITDAVSMASHTGLPGRAARRKQPLWITDLSVDQGFVRGRFAKEDGVRSGFALPIILDDKVAAVLEFFTDRRVEPDTMLIEALSEVGAQISRVIERTRAEDIVRAQVRQQKMIAMLGQDALSGLQQNELYLRTSLTIRGTLDVELCDVLELQADQQSLLVKEGIGWQEGQVGTVQLSSDTGYLPGYALHSEYPVICETPDHESRFEVPDFYLRNGVVSSLCVPIIGGKDAYGVLGVHSRTARQFTREQTAFLQAVASVLAQAIERRRAEDALRLSRERFATLAANIPGFVFRFVMDKSGSGSFAYVSPGAREIFAQDPATILRDATPLVESIHPQDQAGYLRSIAESGRTLEQWRWEGRIKVDDRVKWVQALARPFRAGDGSVFWDGVILDESARKLAESKTHELLEENRRLTKKLISVQEEDYKRLARELHDELGQSLTAIKSDAVLIERHSGPDSKVHVSARAIEEAAEHIYGIAHAMMRRLRPSTLDELGLVDTLNVMVDEWKQRTAIGCKLSVDPGINKLDEEYSMTIYRVIQESLTNVERHARATKVEINIDVCKATTGADYVMLIISDNGVGSDTATMTAKDRFGLLGIRERVEIVGGSMEVRSSANEGFEIKARIPLL